MLQNENLILSRKIVEHLMSKEKMKDDLEGISLAIYESGITNVSKKLNMILSQLISKGIIIQTVDHHNKKYYNLTKHN